MKHTTLCFECEWAGGKDGKCPWACKFEPVPGWKAEPTTVHGNGRNYGSFDVYECPQFELMREIKEGIISNSGKRQRYIKRKNKDMFDKKVKEMRSEGATISAIANELLCDEFAVGRILRRR